MKTVPFLKLTRPGARVHDVESIPFCVPGLIAYKYRGCFGIKKGHRVNDGQNCAGQLQIFLTAKIGNSGE